MIVVLTLLVYYVAPRRGRNRKCAHHVEDSPRHVRHLNTWTLKQRHLGQQHAREQWVLAIRVEASGISLRRSHAASEALLGRHNLSNATCQGRICFMDCPSCQGSQFFAKLFANIEEHLRQTSIVRRVVAP